MSDTCNEQSANFVSTSNSSGTLNMPATTSYSYSYPFVDPDDKKITRIRVLQDLLDTPNVSPENQDLVNDLLPGLLFDLLEIECDCDEVTQRDEIAEGEGCYDSVASLISEDKGLGAYLPQWPFDIDEDSVYVRFICVDADGNLNSVLKRDNNEHFMFSVTRYQPTDEDMNSDKWIVFELSELA